MDKIVVSIDKLGKIYDAAREAGVQEVSFEYVVGSCFPNIMDNIKAEMRLRYTQGFTDGLKEQKEAQ